MRVVGSFMVKSALFLIGDEPILVCDTFCVSAKRLFFFVQQLYNIINIINKFFFFLCVPVRKTACDMKRYVR